MPTNDLIPAEEFCVHYKVGFSFISSLHQYGLIELTSIEETNYIPYTQLQRIEQLMRLYYDLEINMEGIDAIVHLLDRVKTMQAEIAALKNRLSLYEGVS